MAELLQNVVVKGGPLSRDFQMACTRDGDAYSLYDFLEAEIGSVVKEGLALLGRPVREADLAEQDGQLRADRSSRRERARRKQHASTHSDRSEPLAQGRKGLEAEKGEVLRHQLEDLVREREEGDAGALGSGCVLHDCCA